MSTKELWDSVKERREQKFRTVKKVLKELLEKYEISVRPEFQVVSPDEVAKRQSFYDGWDSCCASSYSFTHYYVIYDDGTYTKVPYGYYFQGYADNHTPDIKEVKDIYVGDYLNSNAIGVVEIGKFESDYSSPSYEEEVNVYILWDIDRDLVLNLLKEEIEKLPLEKLLELLARA